MAIPWGTIKSLLIFFGPILLPKAIAQYRALRAAPQIHGIPIRPIPSTVRLSLAVLFATSLIYLILTLPVFASENIFTLTTSRLQIPTDVLFTRLSALRPLGLTPSDNILRQKINSLDSRLLYLQHGPDPLTNCVFCNPDSPNSYLYYSLPTLLLPHLLNLLTLGFVTTGPNGGPWRTSANIGALTLFLGDVYHLASFTPSTNAAATTLSALYFFHWRARIYRMLALALYDVLCAYVLYLSSTNRFFLTPPSTPARIEAATKTMLETRGKIAALGILQNTVKRDQGLRERSEGYWVQETGIMREVMEDRETVEGVTNALENRINMGTIMTDAENYARNLLRPWQDGNA